MYITNFYYSFLHYNVCYDELDSQLYFNENLAADCVVFLWMRFVVHSYFIILVNFAAIVDLFM